ncbi:glycosyltransferase family 4 protein [Nocardia beijingensis]|uniref:glycosyltransferase family 4 protein n=1 Tax=Nocardia beijingensis TaxID=95162 RepID=UPI00344D6CBD
MSRPPLDVLCGFYFYPRGGSAYVARYLAGQVPSHRARLRLLSGSLGPPGAVSNASTFFTGLANVNAVDYSSAAEAFRLGRDPLVEPVPMHASYEDRRGVPDRLFAAAGPAMLAHQERFWSEQLAKAGVHQADVVHLHHLTPQLGPALASGRPVIVHLHGTELKFLKGCERTGIENWNFASLWLEYFRRHAQRLARLVAVSTDDAAAAVELLGVSPNVVETIPNGVDTVEFARQSLSADEQRDCWRRWLVTEPLGWDESTVPGSVRYDEQTLDRLFPADGSRRIVLCVTRFLSFKRVGLLLRSFARIRAVAPSTTLVVWGGYPGEWEGEHPVVTARKLGLDNVVFPGFRNHSDLATAMSSADLLVNTSAHEPFGLVLLQAMSTGTPVLAANAGGPAMYVSTVFDRASGWLFEPENASSLEKTLLEALKSTAELKRRGSNASAFVAGHYSWSSIAERFANLYTDIVAGESVELGRHYGERPMTRAGSPSDLARRGRSADLLDGLPG